MRTIQCRIKIADAIAEGWVIALQWVLSHVGIYGNERADAKAKQGVESKQPNVPFTLNRAKNLIDVSINNATRRTLKIMSMGKKWENPATRGPIPRDLERAEAVAHFRLTTGHDYLQAYLHQIGLAGDDICPLCNLGRMDGDHLSVCSALTFPIEDTTGRYWEARRLMVEEPRTGVG